MPNRASPFEFVALTLPGLADPSVAIAASRAGGIGVVDVSFVDAQRAVGAVATLARYGRGRCGIRLDLADEGVAEAVIPALPPAITLAVLVPADRGLLVRQAELLRARGVERWLEATSLDEARLAVELGLDGVVAKGHEAGGRVGEVTTFVLLQQLRAGIELPVWAQGGIGEHTVAACAAAGAAGVVLDAQLALARESRLPEAVKAAIAGMDGGETACAGREQRYRLYARPGRRAAGELRGLDHSPAEDATAWRARLAGMVGWDSPENAWLLGQDAAFAARLSERYRTVGRVLAGLRQALDEHLAAAAKLRPLAEGAPLARSHGTRFPIVQGPMTRVSDVPGFAQKVAGAGALPFLALALMRGPQAETLLRETQQALAEHKHPWGVGILGFVPLELREEQMEAIRRYPPSFALIAGGRPDQALRLEREGIPTYLHVPSPRLLGLFAGAGARRFVLEGRECGGHVGPRTSFVLWEQMIDALLDSVPAGDLADCHVLFAGGVHDARSAAMAAAMAAPLAGQGVKVGVLAGTAYLFTEEAVAAGAITPGFQHQALRCTGTVLLETGPGHATRCADTSFARAFQQERQRLAGQGLSAEEIREHLELLNLGRLRIAAKGIDRNPAYGQDPGTPEFVTLEPGEQAAQGMYMLGQVAALRDATTTLADLHQDLCTHGSALLDEVARSVPAPAAVVGAGGRAGRPCDVAIVGMSCLLPKAPDLGAYWQNILGEVDAIVEVPVERWDVGRYFDPDPAAVDKVYSRWGGFCDPVLFDPVRYGMPPSSLSSIEPLQLLVLEAVRAALDDAGYLDRPFGRSQAGVVLGVGGGAGELGNRYAVRAALPGLMGQVPSEVLDGLPGWTEDSFPGILLNVAAGRVANRFDLGGINLTVDAACASSLAAVYLAVRELEAGTADLMIAGGADTVQSPFGYLCFSKTRALSPRGRCRPFDVSADGIVISEGVGVLVLKRLSDAQRDGDRVYAVIKGIGSSSDGRDKGLTAPRPAGQVLALQRAYVQAGFSPATVGLIEAHGTGTAAGDRAEVEALTQVLGGAGASAQGCAVGSVKSMIGHTKCAAGVAGLIKAALGLRHKVIPPTLGVQRPNLPDGGPLYVSSQPRPWLRAPGTPPRRAGVSAFGFGGTNFHVAVEEPPEQHAGDGWLPDDGGGAPARVWPSELFVWAASSRRELAQRVGALDRALDRALGQAAAEPRLREVARAVWAQSPPGPGRSGLPLRLAVVASSIGDLRSKLGRAREALAGSDAEVWDRGGVYLTGRPLAGQATVAFLYPGQGCQHPGMLADLAVCFSEVREAFEAADAVLAGRLGRPLSSFVLPPPAFSLAGERAQAERLARTDRAQPALGAAGVGLSRLLAALGIRPCMAGGHSYGELAALCEAGVIAEDTLYDLSEARGRCILDTAEDDLGMMAAAAGTPGRVQQALDGLGGVWVANLNAPAQTVISGTRQGIDRAVGRLAAAGIAAKVLPVPCGFHCPLVAPARDRLAKVLASVAFAAPRLPVYANATAAAYPREPAQIVELLTGHLVRPVRFVEQVEAMHAAGARLFVEVGPGATLTGLAGQILDGRPHLAVATQNPAHSHGLTALLHALAQLAAHGADLDLERLYEGRVTRRLRLDALAEDLRPAPLPDTAWLVDGGSARPAHAAPTAEEPPAPRPQEPIPSGGADAVVVRFQQLMTKFLDVQQEVMTAYLRGAGDEAPALPASVPAQPALLPPPSATEAAPTAPTAEELTLAPPDADRVTRALVRIVAERTGYPPEMIGLDLDLEADLGIDSIKRVEILSTAGQELWPSGDALGGEGMETLVRAKTLRAVVEAIMAMDVPGRDDRAPAAAGETPPPTAAIGPVVPRFVTAVIDAPAGQPTGLAPLPGVVVITDDEQGIAGDLAALLQTRGIEVALVRDQQGPPAGQGALEAGAGGYAARLGDPQAAQALVEAIRQRQGPIAGLVHLLPLRPGPALEELDTAGWQERLDIETKALFHLAQAAAADLRRPERKARLLAAVRLDGAFASHQPGQPFQPSQAGVAGLVKTLAREWPEVACKVIDLGPTNLGATDLGPTDLGAALPSSAERLFAELESGDGQVEVGWRGDRRITIGLASAPLPEATGQPPTGQPLIDQDCVLLITGGARGITAAAACALARRYRPTIVVVGRSALPDPQEAAGTAGITEPAALKAALAAMSQRPGQPVTPRLVEAAYRRLLADREMRANLAVMAEAGACVSYHQVDVRDAEAFARLIGEVYACHGRIDGVIHGAGVIEDKLVQDKTTDSFDRVMGTKTLPAFVLARALRPETLRFLVLFSSVSARFGNRGQADYAAANEVLNKLAVWLDARWPARVVSLLWGPWKTVGMASGQLARLLEQQGVQLIPPHLGAAALIDELDHGNKGNAEVILGAGPWQAAARPGIEAVASRPLSQLAGAAAGGEGR